jgi:aldehyde:ferredoxin oxidoreductase
MLLFSLLRVSQYMNRRIYMNTYRSHLYGYAGKLLRIDLSQEKVFVEGLDSGALRKFIGGVGYAAQLLYNELPEGIDPLSPENKLIFSTGPLTGTGAPGSGSVEVCFKSPLTGIWGEARAGGEWGGALKKAGYDFLIIEGKAKEAKYIVIQDGKIEIRPAEILMGKSTSQKEELLRKEELKDDSFEFVEIGLAGENLVNLACIMSNARAFGRGGAGAVMGAKNLLAVAVKGTGEIPIAHPDEFSSACKEYNKKVLEVTAGKGMAPDGTTGLLVGCDNVGDLPTKNWRSNSWGRGEEIYAHFINKNLVKAESCYKGCVLRCKRICKVDSGRWKTPVHEGGEYETMSAFTFFVFSEDVDAAVHADYLCNEYGLDTISTGAVIAFAMDCYENGIINDVTADGLDLSWGNAETIVTLVNKIASKDSLGALLGKGVRYAAQELGNGADKLAVHIKGLEGPAHDPRSGKALAVTYALGNRGMCHIHPLNAAAYDSRKNNFGLIPYGLTDPQTLDRWKEEGKGKEAKFLQDFGIIPDVLGICKFYIFRGIGPDELARLLSTLTGWDINGREILTIGERVYNLQRKFNVKEGIGKADDMLPERCLQMPEFGKYSSTSECQLKDPVGMIEECYKARGWSKEGIPQI